MTREEITEEFHLYFLNNYPSDKIILKPGEYERVKLDWLYDKIIQMSKNQLKEI